MIQTNFTSYVPGGNFVSRASGGSQQQTSSQVQDGLGQAHEDAGLMPSRLPASDDASQPAAARGFASLARTFALCAALLAAGGLTGCASMGQHGRGPSQEPPSASYQIGNGLRDVGVGIYRGVLKPISDSVRDTAVDFGRGISGKPAQEQPPAQQRR